MSPHMEVELHIYSTSVPRINEILLAPLHVATLTVQRELRDYIISRVSTLPLYQELMKSWLHFMWPH